MTEYQPLDICAKFFDALNDKNIRYCHWKSNCRLMESLAGETDLDLLLDVSDQEIFLDILSSLGFKPVQSPPKKQYPGIEDYLGFDVTSGRLIHLHLHFNLILGEKEIKNHHLPWESWLLSNFKLTSGVRVPIPEIELLLLIIRSHLKLDFTLRTLLRYLLMRRVFPKSILEEYNFLISEINQQKFKDVVDSSGLNIDYQRISKVIKRHQENRVSLRRAFATRRTLASRLTSFERFGFWTKLKRKLMFTLRFPNGSFLPNRKKLGSKRLYPQGRSFALVGADGSGKSSLAKDLDLWLSWKLSVGKYYMGIPKSKFVKLMKLLIRGIELFKNVPVFQSHLRPIDRTADYLRGWLWIWIAKCRLRISNHIEKDLKQGSVVLVDRYPLAQFGTMTQPMDGPRIRKELGFDSLASKEEEIYKRVKLPDKAFILKTSFEELRNRKSDLDLKLHQEKAEAVNKLEHSSINQPINGDRLYEEVLLDLKTHIWRLI